MRISLCVLLFVSFYVFINKASAQIVANFSMDRVGGCSPLKVDFTNTSSGLSPNAAFSWSFGNGNSSTLRNPSAVFINETTYNVTLTVTDGTQSASITKTVTVYKKPTANFSVASSKVCLPAAAQFTSTSTAGDGSIQNYQWDFGDGSTQQTFSNTANYFYSVEQTATVSLLVTNSHGCQASITKQNIVEILPRINPSFTVNKTLLCSLADTVKFTNNSTGPGTLQYLWDFGDGNTSAQQHPRHLYNNKAVYNAKLTVSNTVGCSATSNPVQINAAYFNTDFTARPLCREVAFTNSSFIFPNSSFWQFGNGVTANSFFGVTYNYPTAGTYNVTLINTYGACKDTITKPVVVQDAVSFNSNITMPASACVNASSSFTSTASTTPSLIRWDFGDGYTWNTSSQTVNHTYTQPGTYTVKMTNVFGTCSEVVTKQITVNALPNTQGFIANYGGVCGAPVTINFSDTTAGAVAWQWHLGWISGSPFSTSQNAAYTFNSDGNYYVYLTVTNAAGCTKTVGKPVNVFRPNASIHYTYSSSPKGNYDCDSLRIKLAVNTNQTIQSYSWNLGNGNTSTSATPEAFYNQPGIYTVTLNYVTESGCSGTAVYSVRVYDKPDANFAYTIPCGNALNLQFRDISFFSDYWNWEFGDGGTSYGTPTPSHNYADTGLYTVRFINRIGRCADTVVKTVHANVLPSSVSITRADNTCSGTRGTVLFDHRSVRASGGTWDFGDGTIIPYDSSAHPVSHTYAATGTYLVKLTSYYNGCTLTSVQQVRVLLKQNPLLTANKTEICASDQLNIQISNLQPNPFSFSTWNHYYLNNYQYNTGATFTGNQSFSNWSTSNIYTSTLTGFTAGTTRMRAIVQASNTGCYDTTNYIDLLVNGPVSKFGVQNNDLCFKKPFVFIDSSRRSTATPLTTWFWEFGDGFTQTNSNNSSIQHTYALPGRYLVRLRVTDASGCSAVFSAFVNAKGTKAAFTPSGLFIPNVPLNTTVTFYNNSSSYNTNPTFTWYYGDGASSTGYTGSHTYTQAGTDTVKLIANDPSIPCSDTAQKIITVKDFNTAFSFTTSFLGSNSCPPVMVRITNLSVGFTRLVWDFGDGTTSTSAYYPTHIYHSPGTYRITLYTYGYNGLTGTYVDSVTIKQPSAQIYADTLQGCLQQNVNFGASTQYIVNYLWDFGNGTLGTSLPPVAYAYSTPGQYTVRLIGKDSNGCAASAALPSPVIIDSLGIKIKGIPPIVCDSALIQFNPDINSYSAANLGAQLIYKWDFGTGNPADTSNIRNPSFRYLLPGIYVVKLKVLSPFGCLKETQETIVVNQKANGTITALPEVCQDGSIQFSASATPSVNVQWNWNFDNGNTATVPNPPQQVYTSAGNYTVTLLVTRNGCIDTVTHLLTVHPKPVVNAQPRQQVICLGNSVQLSASGGASYNWSPAAGLNNTTTANPVATPAASTQYFVTATTNKGCSSKDSVLITVAQPVQVQLPAALDLCRGQSIQLNATGADSYQWINNTTGLSSTSIHNPVANPNLNAVYTVVGSERYNCFRDTAEVTITLRNIPTVNAGPDVEIAGNAPYQLSAAASNDVTSWLWTPNERLSCNRCPSPVVTPKMETAYTVRVSNQWGCSSSDTVLIKLQCGIGTVYIPSAFTPNRDGKNDVFYIAGSGVKTINHLRIYNRWGEIIFERSNFAIDDPSTGWNGKYKGQFVGTGTYVYLAEMECSSGETFTLKGTVTVIQ
jgi:gliding motility-associated-like protein